MSNIPIYDEFTFTTSCQRCTCECPNIGFSSHPVGNSKAIEEFGIDLILCCECMAIFIMKYFPDDQYLVRQYEKNMEYNHE
jgi:hypothetical protein